MKARIFVVWTLIGTVAVLALFASLYFERTGVRNSPTGSDSPLATASMPFPSVSDTDGSMSMASTAPSAGASALSAVDGILDQLPFGNIAFNAPGALNIDDTAIIELVLDLAKPIEELKKMVEAAGEKEGARIRVSDLMEARLSGSNFAITAVTSEEQAVTHDDVTRWKWEVKPKAEGRQYLHLTLSVLIHVNGLNTRRAIRTFDKEISIEIRWEQQALSFLKSNWQWLWVTILVPVAGWLWKRRKASNGGHHDIDT